MGEVERHLEVGTQEPGLQDSPCRPLEPPSHPVKEESDMEQELGEGQLLVVVCGAFLGNFGDCG